MVHLTIPREELYGMWTLPDGRHDISLSKEDKEYASSRTLVKDKKMLLVITRYKDRFHPERKTPSALDIVAFPRPDHFVNFLCASEGLRPNGPSAFNPYGIGSMYVQEGDLHSVDYARYLHSNFKVGDKLYQLSRELADKYAGWRKRCLKEAIKEAHNNNKDLLIPEDPKKHFSPLLKTELEKVCKRLGLKIEKRDEFHAIVRSKS